jgi:hypothetical protein
MGTKLGKISRSSAWEYTKYKWGGAFHKKKGYCNRDGQAVYRFHGFTPYTIVIDSRKFDLLL